MTGVVITGGDAPILDFIIDELENADFIIAADSGLDTLASYGFQPDLVMGDMDSVSEQSLCEIAEDKIIEYPADKDYTDTELALDYLLKNGYSKRVLIGGGGGRLDHIIALYSLFSKEYTPHLWITEKEKIFLVVDKFSIKLKKNTLISFFPVGNTVCRMTSTGLKWKLDSLRWKIGDSGISNLALKETIMVNMICGKLIMIISQGER